jgi:site-specific recombinase XerD
LKPYSNPVIRKPKSGQWYIDFNYQVPSQLKEYYPRSTKRFKKYGDINLYHGEERERNAEQLRQDWLFCLKELNYNPFQAELEKLGFVEMREQEVGNKRLALEAEAAKQESRPVEEQRKDTPIYKALELFIESRKERIDNGNSMSSYRGTLKWLAEYFALDKRLKDPVSLITHLDISRAVMLAKNNRKWGNTTYNNEVNMAMTIFNWFEKEYYIDRNPSNGRIDKLKTKKTIHEWYKKDAAALIKQALLENDCIPVYRACQFTYFLCIRSKVELLKLKVGNIDRVLKRVHFSADLSKNEQECYRDYPEGFEKVLEEMNLSSYPSHFYVFGKNGVPGENPCHKDFLANQFKPIRESLPISTKHTIYSWKHTRVIHEMMKNADPYQIQHMCRHTDLKTTMDYMRGFDLSLRNVYDPEDLTF